MLNASLTTSSGPPSPDGNHPVARVKIETARLANGMQIVSIPDRRCPVVTHMVWYRNGSADDLPGQSGTAHFLEHLMFKGTERYPAGQFSAFLGSVGGEENAFTSWNYTCYHQQVPRQHLRACMAFEADRMCRLEIDETIAATERSVVLEERAMSAEAQPHALLEEAMAAAALPGQPTGRPIIGWRHEIEGLAGADAQAYHRRFYVPENAILVVAGDADLETVVALAEETYGAIPAGETALARRAVPNPLAATRQQITLADPRARQDALQRLHMVPSPRTAAPGEAPALEVLSYLLGGDRTSLLHRRLVVEKPCATSISTTYLSDYFIDQSRFYIGGSPVAGTSPEALDDAVEAVLQTVRETGFSVDAIARAKTQLIADALYGRDSQVRLAIWYGRFLALGLDFADLAAWELDIEAVTPEALASALRHLDRGRSVSGYLVAPLAA